MSELRSKISQKILKLSEIQKPPHDTTILIRANVAKIASDIKKDVPVEPVIVAHLKGKYYPVGRLDILAAYKQSGVESLCCDIIQADSMRDILEAHIRSSRRGPINPISMIDVVSQIKEEADPDMEFIPLEYRKFDRLELGDSICKKFNNFVTELGERFEILPTLHHLLVPISKLEVKDQGEALDVIINYSMTEKGFYPPDLKSLRKLLDQFSRTDDDVKITDDVVKEPAKKKRDAGGIDVKVRVKDTETSKPLSPIPHTISHKCKCKREYVVNTKNSTIREVKQSDADVLVLDGDYGDVKFAMPEKAVSFLELKLQPKTFSHYVGGTKHGHTLIFSKRNIPKSSIIEIRRILDGKKK